MPATFNAQQLAKASQALREEGEKYTGVKRFTGELTSIDDMADGEMVGALVNWMHGQGKAYLELAAELEKTKFIYADKLDAQIEKAFRSGWNIPETKSIVADSLAGEWLQTMKKVVAAALTERSQGFGAGR